MAQGTGPRPVGASAGAEEAKETFPEFLRALWVPAGAEATAAGGEGAGVRCGLGEERAEHGEHCFHLREAPETLLLGAWAARDSCCAAQR